MWEFKEETREFVVVFILFYEEKDLVIQQKVDILCGVGHERWYIFNMDNKQEIILRIR